ncbi:DUF7482 domain-containing protein [Marinomonas mediterranea]|jgi:hypothetical protein|uniref:DUF7482 domain-containing protein n=1 Tax=Marinomonas mediterranea (strain ATCC 700492 / JCM 21426 / NBRC 103028 / MMB-1) TaxID=717774 RepID=F2JYQ5_MARM1|nr:hypothetical protein [Marinomonas mediterranea]ADZ89680.1 hypothetical protein Marme_0380 [Marinomonas mediterranea MMB-1]WCN07772.1 hypothetical protein GV055_01945 [Marinomonas mediterranea]WCN11871.1 hypothetical protein GV054_01970 [Marinomonas mediterranea]WCN15916.1 hypothetical protein GV053_01920 [Marinomonas mediterranea MMB-1]
MKIKIALSCLLAVLLTACSSNSYKDLPMQMSMPVFPAWYEGKEVFYITTDVSDKEMAEQMNANYTPRLRDAIPRYPKPPRVKTALERVYGFPGGEQRNVFPSAPWPVGPKSTDTQYSPLWLMYWVKWTDPEKAYELKSEGDIYAAERKGLVTINRSRIVVNCPVVPNPNK